MPISEKQLAQIRKKQREFLEALIEKSQLWTKEPDVSSALEAGQQVGLEKILVSEFLVYWVNAGDIDKSYLKIADQIRQMIQISELNNEKKAPELDSKVYKETKIFLAHASEDKDAIHQLYVRLKSHGFRPWLDEIDLIPGQNWQLEIPKAIQNCDIFIACLTKRAIAKEGYVQKEFRMALNAYAQKPPGSIYLMPVKLDDCNIPEIQLPQLGVDLRDIQWLDLWKEGGFERLVDAINQSTSSKKASHSMIAVKPKFVTDRIAGNQLGFTVINPLKSLPIRITDIKITSSNVIVYTAVAEKRFNLSDVVIPSPTTTGDHNILTDLSTSESIYYEKQVVLIDQNDSASFNVRLFADDSYSSGVFTLSITYVDSEGKQLSLSSDAIYFASKSFRMNAIEHLEAVSFRDVYTKLQKQDCSVLELLQFFQESEFVDLDIFDLLVDILQSGKCIELETPFLIDLVGCYTNTQTRKDATLNIIKNLDDVTDFEEKYYFIINLVRQKDERVITFALSLLPKIKIRHQLKWSGDTTAYLALFRLQDMLSEYMGVKVSVCQEALERNN